MILLLCFTGVDTLRPAPPATTLASFRQIQPCCWTVALKNKQIHGRGSKNADCKNSEFVGLVDCFKFIEQIMVCSVCGFITITCLGCVHFYYFTLDCRRPVVLFKEFYLCFSWFFSYFHVISTQLCLLLFLVKLKIKKPSQAGIYQNCSTAQYTQGKWASSFLPLSSSGGPSYDLSIAALKLSLQPRPRTMFCRGRWNGSSSLFLLTSDMAVCRLSKELDFFRPRVGPSSTDGGAAVDTTTDTTRMKQC